MKIYIVKLVDKNGEYSSFVFGDKSEFEYFERHYRDVSSHYVIIEIEERTIISGKAAVESLDLEIVQ